MSISFKTISTAASKLRGCSTATISKARKFFTKPFKSLQPLERDTISITQEGLLEKAKNKVIEALKSGTPYEHSVIIDPNKNKIIKEAMGTSEHVSIPFKGEKGLAFKLGNHDYKLINVHGHPTLENGVITPISLDDFTSMNSNAGEHKCIVYNEFGEHSILTKKDSFKELSKQKIQDLNNKFDAHMVKSLPKEEQEYWINLYKTDPQKLSTLNEEFTQMIIDHQGTERGAKAIHNFWQENAENLGLIYETNYDCFI